MNGEGSRWRLGSDKRKTAVLCVSAMIWAATMLLGGCAAQSEQLTPETDNIMPSGQLAAVSPAPADREVAVGHSAPQLIRDGFTVLDFRARRDEFDRVFVIGEVRNVGALERGVELQAVLRDPTGRLLTVGHFNLASGRSIAPDQTWPFAYSFGRQQNAASAELRIVRTFRTVDAPGATSAFR